VVASFGNSGSTSWIIHPASAEDTEPNDKIADTAAAAINLLFMISLVLSLSGNHPST
jgi:hypothetical protein